MNRCRFAWWSQYRGDVQCWLEAGHGDRHMAWSSRKDRRKWPTGASWIAVGAEHSLASWMKARWL